MEVGGARMQSQQAQVAAVKADIDKTNAALSKAEVGIKTAGRCVCVCVHACVCACACVYMCVRACPHVISVVGILSSAGRR